MTPSKAALSSAGGTLLIAAEALDSGGIDMKTADRDTVRWLEDTLGSANTLLRGVNLLGMPAVARLRVAAILTRHYDSLTYKRGEFDE